jgi:hypothetical protein
MTDKIRDLARNTVNAEIITQLCDVIDQQRLEIDAQDTCTAHIVKDFSNRIKALEEQLKKKP